MVKSARGQRTTDEIKCNSAARGELVSPARDVEH